MIAPGGGKKENGGGEWAGSGGRGNGDGGGFRATSGVGGGFKDTSGAGGGEQIAGHVPHSLMQSKPGVLLCMGS
nr:hypothetical protein Itr_chr01CG10820 [Ipomoea trifida]